MSVSCIATDGWISRDPRCEAFDEAYEKIMAWRRRFGQALHLQSQAGEQSILVDSNHGHISEALYDLISVGSRWATAAGSWRT